MRAFSEVDPKILKMKTYLHHDFPEFKIPIKHYLEGQPPFVVCVAKLRYAADIQAAIEEVGRKLNRELAEGVDYWFVC